MEPNSILIALLNFEHHVNRQKAISFIDEDVSFVETAE